MNTLIYIFMNIQSILQSFWADTRKKDLVIMLVSFLKIDDKQKNLYLESIDLIDEKSLENIYSQFVDLLFYGEDLKNIEQNKERTFIKK